MRFVEDEESKQQYKKFLEGNERCNFQQSLEWAEVKKPNWKPEVILAEDEDKNIIGSLCVWIRKMPIFGNIMYASRGPVCDIHDISVMKQLTDGAKELAKKYNAIGLRIEPDIEKEDQAFRDIVTNLGYKLYDVIYEKEAKDYYLRIFIDSENGISLEDCEKVNNAITEILDEKDYIKDQYFLEVSSPGIERVLRKDWQLEENIGQEVEIKLFKPFNGEKLITGILNGFNEETINIDEQEIPRKDISLIKIKYNW